MNKKGQPRPPLLDSLEGENYENSPPSSSSSMTENGRNGSSAAASNVSQSQVVEMLGNLNLHGHAITQLLEGQRKLEDDVARVEEKVGRHDAKLKMMESQIDKLKKARNPGHHRANRAGKQGKKNPPGEYRGNRAGTRNNNGRTGAPKVQKAPSSAKRKYAKVRCNGCQKALSSSYIRSHMKQYCPILRRGQ